MKIGAATVQALVGFIQCSAMLWFWTAGEWIWSGRIIWVGSLICVLLWIRADYRMAKFRRDMGDIEAWVRREAEKRGRR